MTVYRNARRDANTERGLEAAIKAILSDPKFLYRFEYEPRNVAHGQSYRITDLELASRLSFFLWSAPPDDQLIEVAAAGRLHDPIVLERETRRMLNDPRSEALALNFAGQWFRVANLESSDPSAEFFPSFDEELRQAMRRESQLFFDSIVREDRNVIDLLTANYTFVNERLARHYGIPNVSGAEFRRVALSPEFEGRQGLLGKAAILTVTSRLDRTSPVTRGTWVSGILLGIHPPPPPPNVPALKPRWTEPNPPSMRELMIQHRVRPDCATCHDLFEAFGIALENFDGIGAWRTRFSGKDLDVSGTLMDGTKIKTLTDLRVALVGRSDQFIQTLTNKLFIYALGRGVDAGDMPVIRSITRDASRDNNRFSRIVVSFVTNPVFQMNTKE
jgi:hypothetical protein